MYIKLEKVEQEKLIQLAINKAGSYRKLVKIIKIPRTSILRYKQLGVIPEKRYEEILKFIGIERETIKTIKLEDNWKQILGGKMCVKIKKEKGTFEKQLKKAQKLGAKGLKEWHKKMKKEKPKEYYLIQYQKFKKISGYKYKTKNGERVRNKFEEKVANKLRELGIKYEYEPLIRINKKRFFPDFLINKKVIIEATEWNGETKAYSLKEKIKHLEKKYKVFVIIPKHLYSKYKILDNNLLVGLDNLDLVAQLVRAGGC